MAKKSVKIEDVEFNAQKVGIEKDKTEALVNDLRAMLEEESADKEPKNPKEYLILVSDPNGVIKTDLVGWPIQIPEGEDAATVVERISKVAAQYNNTKKGQKMPIQNLAETIEVAQPKLFKENEIFTWCPAKGYSQKSKSYRKKGC